MTLLCDNQLICMPVFPVPYFFGYKTEFFLPKQSQKSRSVLKDGSRYLGLFGKSETDIIAKFHRTDLVICSHSKKRRCRLIAE